jgi:LuxR family transcriptional regulator, maltose regulon positive regulatory protein
VKRGRPDSPFFRSKFRVPTPPPHFVRRPRLISLLDDLSEYPVTVLVAPAGAGKAALAADWVRHSGRRSAWLALEESDRHPYGFLTALASALDELAPGCASGTLAMLRRPHEPQDPVHVLVEALEDVTTERTVLVVDDVHLIDDDPQAVACLEAFVEHKPAWLDLVLLSRRRPALAVDRLRASGVLADVTFDALRFTDAEATEMLTGLCPDASPESLAAVTEWAGGWAAAVQLTALAVRSQRAGSIPHPQAAPAPPDGLGRLVDEYVWHEVLRAERPEMIELLLSVSVVSRVSYPLAEALSGHADAGDLLVEAEQRGLFVTELGASGWFEVHALVRAMLCTELERRWPERLQEQHARAARWFESVDDGTNALEHWLAAGRPREALRLLADLAVDLFGGARGSEIRRVLDQLQPTLPDPDVDALIELAWCQLLVDRVSFDAAMAAAESAVRDREEVPDRLMILRAAAALVAGDWRGCEELARTALAAMTDHAWLDPLGRFGWSLVARGIALDERWLDSGLEVGQVSRGISNDSRRAAALDGTRALGLALAGHPLEAMRTTAAVRPAADAGGPATLRAELALADALALRELGDRELARQQLEGLAARSSYPSVLIQLVA